ncbi:MAG: MtrB/PioB family outer membrane beta-barrel protein [Betaproteobacteria bacterium]|nr:MtrB/PioB family outer membrane beta-barrel protein [Betaproteobacteria bacterium]
MSPGNGQIDIAFPTEYTTRNATVEGGYSSKTMQFAVSWMTSKFENDNKFVDWNNGFYLGQDRTYLEADNKYSRLAANATIRKLPFNSTLALRFTDDELKSNTNLGTTVLGAAGAALTTLPNTPTYDGKVEHEPSRWRSPRLRCATSTRASS